MRHLSAFAFTLLLAMHSLSADATPQTSLTVKDIADGWVMLYDGKSTYGWDVKDEAAINQQGALAVAPAKAVELRTQVAFAGGSLRITYTAAADCALTAPGVKHSLKAAAKPTTVSLDYRPESPSVITFVSPKDAALSLQAVLFQPANTKPIFDGKTLDGWKLFEGDPARKLSQFEVTRDGELHLTNGPGDLQTTGKYADFALQFDCKTNGDALNSGIFFRCIDNQYQNGYECQIHNGVKDGKPADFGTGAIYRRQPARKIVAKDREWFTVTLIASGPTFATWVNGYPTLVWTDTRPRDENPRKGLRLDAGHLSIQGHDKTTDIHFRNLRLAEWKAKS